MELSNKRIPAIRDPTCRLSSASFCPFTVYQIGWRFYRVVTDFSRSSSIQPIINYLILVWMNAAGSARVSHTYYLEPIIF